MENAVCLGIGALNVIRYKGTSMEPIPGRGAEGIALEVTNPTELFIEDVVMFNEPYRLCNLILHREL